MKHIFLINPAAGKDEAKTKLEADIRSACAASGAAYEIYHTTAPHDATKHVQDCCKAEPGEELRFYACGGDGTLNEVATGAYPFPNASVTVIPCGSGNDFVKAFGGAEKFNDIPKLMAAEAKPIDLIKANEHIAVNVLNFGFDTTVAKTIPKVRRKPIIGGSNAYTTGIVTALLTAMVTKCSIQADGEELTNGKILLCTIGNGQYVGGSFKCAPRAKVDDGLLEVCVFKTISHIRFVQVLGPYTAGQHLDDPKFADIITYRRAKHIVVTGTKKPLMFSLDGELITAEKLDISVMEGALRFANP
ncbi:YegS//BmrU family lipid kinase [Lachnospiraceae bacterium 10-1]|nr:YegS//BmrU family lipid kinase [Lachnospiraceae bacterium 10-1]